MKKFITRAIFGLLYAAVIVYSLAFEITIFHLLIGFFAALGIHEIYSMLFKNSREHFVMFVIDTVAAWAIISSAGMGILWPAMAALAVRMIAQVMSKGEALEELKCSALALTYVAAPFAALSACLNFRGGNYFVLLVFCFIWVSDTGAYMVGSLIGKHKMCPRISPKKSWEGLAGGLALCAIVGFLLPIVWPYIFGTEMVFTRFIVPVIGVVVGVFATFGDLVESLIKRSVGVKDSGQFLPGHGGLLDRVDSLLLVAPAVYALLAICD